VKVLWNHQVTNSIEKRTEKMRRDVGGILMEAEMTRSFETRSEKGPSMMRV
jgi:hypothetical protein